ncbi:alpha/beta fold hydrolase [Bacillus sp. NTK071]|uniref:alpha/beta hydrolase n=1 Tax=Bacillus sp. NTK071 TaxID=2802175 RepID=UPI001A8E2418|nr:alpha/beta fold hydrolase [Bacillus sp. NTK071]MBN8210859.1 alpha/beta fold hydrolase [Bacillus sp. NTK071]
MVGCMLIHGFTGAPYEVEPLAEYFKSQTNWILSVPTLPGHGEADTLRGVTYNQWIATAEASLKELMEKCDTIYLIGFSMGGVLAGYLATKYQVDKLVLLSAAIHYIHPIQMIKDIGGMITDLGKGKLLHNELFSRYSKKLKTTPVLASIEFRKLVQRLKPSFKRVSVPTIILQGKLDGMVPYKTAHTIYHLIDSDQKQVCIMEKSKHLICHGEDQNDVIDKVFAFLTN